MSEITWRQLETELAKPGHAKGPAGRGGVFLLHGEELVCRRCLDTLLSTLLGPKEPAEFHHDLLDGAVQPLSAALERANTFSLLGGAKVVTLIEPSVLHPKQGARTRWLQSARTAMAAGDVAGAARHFMRLLVDAGLQPQDLSGPDGEQAIASLGSEEKDRVWLMALAEQCRETALPTAAAAEEAEVLAAALERGLPPGNHLVLVTVAADRRGKAYKALSEYGLVVDCSVPGGERRAERSQRQEVLRELAMQVLEATAKRLEPEAFRLLDSQAGHDLRAFQGELEKLVTYVGERTAIRAADVEAVLSTQRSDPLFDLTGAIGERAPGKAVALLTRILRRQGEDAMHPLQLLTALTNYVRRLIVTRDALERCVGGAWQPESSYNEFQALALPQLERYDAKMRELLVQWDDMLETPPQQTDRSAAGKRIKAKRTASTESDLLLIRKGGSPYALYMLCRQAARFSPAELREAFMRLSQADRRMKRSGGLDPLLLLTDLVLKICTPARPPA